MQKEMAGHLANASYVEIESPHGHDGFLIETEKITESIEDYLHSKLKERCVLKFGGSSLQNGAPLSRSIEIISKAHSDNPVALIVSARGNTTDRLLELYAIARNGGDRGVWLKMLSELIEYQKGDSLLDLSTEHGLLEKLLDAVNVISGPVPTAEAQIVAFGELLSAKHLSYKLTQLGFNVITIDAREILFTSNEHGQEVSIDEDESNQRVVELFKSIKDDTIPIITGYIASDKNGNTTNLGRNGSNYSATLIAKYISALEVQNWSDVNGVYSANPQQVKAAVPISQLSYREANELANFGVDLLHSKTILPLMDSKIPLRILNSFDISAAGTLITNQGAKGGVKAVTLLDKVALVKIEGEGLSGKIGIDSRIFSKLSQHNISVRLISQASAERGIGFVIDEFHQVKAREVLLAEFEKEIVDRSISGITVNSEVNIIAITGRHNYALEKAIASLRSEKIWIHLFSNSISGEHISLVIDSRKAIKALNVVHEQVVN